MVYWGLYKQRRSEMSKTLTLEFWVDDGWFVGRLKEVPSVFSQGETIEELEENIRDAYHLMLETEPTLNRTDVRIKEIEVRRLKRHALILPPDKPRLFPTASMGRSMTFTRIIKTERRLPFLGMMKSRIACVI